MHLLYIDLQPRQTCHSKDGGSAYSIGVSEPGWRCGTGLKSHGTLTDWCIGREWPGERERHNADGHKSWWGSIYCSSFRSLSHTSLSIKTERGTYFSRRRCRSILLCRRGIWRRARGNLEKSQRKIPLFTKACPVAAPCVLSRPSSTYIEEFMPHRLTILIPLLIAPTSHKRPSRK